MLTHHPNPIVRRFMHRNPTTGPDATFWLVCAGIIVPAISIVLLRPMHYPLAFFQLVGPAMMVGVLFLVVLINMGMVALAGRETRGDAHQLLYLTDVDAKQVAWGFVLWMTWRLRFWLVLCGWMIWVVGMSATVVTYHTFQTASVLSSATRVPTAPQTLAYAIIWGLQAAAMMVAVIGMAGLSAFQGLLKIETLFRIPALFALMGIPVGFFMTMALVIAGDYGPVAAAMVLGVGIITSPVLLTGLRFGIATGKLVEVALAGWWNATVGWAGLGAWGIVVGVFAGLTGVDFGVISVCLFIGAVFFLNVRRAVHFWGDVIGLASTTTAAVHVLLAAVWVMAALQEGTLGAFGLLLLWAILTGLVLNLTVIGLSTVNTSARFVWRTIDDMQPTPAPFTPPQAL